MTKRRPLPTNGAICKDKEKHTKLAKSLLRYAKNTYEFEYVALEANTSWTVNIGRLGILGENMELVLRRILRHSNNATGKGDQNIADRG